MARIEIDTKELNEQGLEIQKSVKLFNDKLNELFLRVESVPDVTREWVGSSAIKYVNLAKVDKIKYYKLKDDLDIYGKFLCEVSESAETCINRVRGMFDV